MIRIGIIGPESSGKSVLAHQLEAHYGGVTIDEYARTYVEQLSRDYTYDDVCRIVEQDRQDILLERSEPFAFFDAGLIIDAVWLDVCFRQRPAWLTAPLPEELRMDFYLLTEPDIEWKADPTRENGSDDRRRELFNIYLREVELTGRPFGIVSGTGDERTRCAIRLIDRFLQK